MAAMMGMRHVAAAGAGSAMCQCSVVRDVTGCGTCGFTQRMLTIRISELDGRDMVSDTVHVSSCRTMMIRRTMTCHHSAGFASSARRTLKGLNYGDSVGGATCLRTPNAISLLATNLFKHPATCAGCRSYRSLRTIDRSIRTMGSGGSVKDRISSSSSSSCRIGHHCDVHLRPIQAIGSSNLRKTTLTWHASEGILGGGSFERKWLLRHSKAVSPCRERNLATKIPQKPSRKIVCMAMTSHGANQLSAALFTLATAFVMPFYTLMILAPQWKMTRKVIKSYLPYIALGGLYLFLLALSWTPETMGLMFASKYWLPELPGITRMFKSTVTVASAWIHLLAVDLFAARHVFLDGLDNGIETRHTLALCLMFGPIGIFSHFLTKAFTKFWRAAHSGNVTEEAKGLLG